MRGTLRPFGSYVIAFTLVISWWFFAFRQPHAEQVSPIMLLPAVEHSDVPPISLTLDRSRLHQALTGDTALMIRLMADWDLESELCGTQRLPRRQFLQAQQIGRVLLNAGPEALTAAQESARASFVVDDSGTPIDLTLPFSRFLPQTYFSAGIALALLDPQCILGLPEGMRAQAHIYPSTLTDTVPADINRYGLEELYRQNPEVAFVAPYSHPATQQVLRDQGVVLHTLSGAQNVDEIKRMIIQIGHIVNNPLKAELLCHFIDAALLQIDNMRTPQAARPLVLEHYQTFHVPDTNSLTRHLFSCMGYALPDWETSVSEEQIRQYNPDLLIICSSTPAEQIAALLAHSEALRETEAVRSGRVAVIDDALQKTYSQFFILAYYDLSLVLSQ